MGKLDKFKKAKSTEQVLTPDSGEKKPVRYGFNKEIIESGEVIPIHLASIEVNPRNDYHDTDDEKDIETLAKDIEKNGLLHNLVVYEYTPGKYRLLSGERRYRALKLLCDRYGDEYKMAGCRVVAGAELSPEQEMIYIDSANLNSRGAIDGKKLVRFIENIKRVFGYSDEEANEISANLIAVSERTISRTLAAEQMVEELRVLLQNNYFQKQYAERFLALSEKEQRYVAAVVNKAIAVFHNDRTKIGETVNEIIEVTKKDSRSKLAETLAAIEDKLNEAAAKEGRPQDEENKPVLSQREKYIANICKMTTLLNAYAAPKRAQRIARYDMDEPHKNEIMAALDEMIAAANRLKEEVSNAG